MNQVNGLDIKRLDYSEKLERLEQNQKEESIRE